MGDRSPKVKVFEVVGDRSGIRVWGFGVLGYGVWGLGFRVWGLGLRVKGFGA